MENQDIIRVLKADPGIQKYTISIPNSTTSAILWYIDKENLKDNFGKISVSKFASYLVRDYVEEVIIPLTGTSVTRGAIDEMGTGSQ